MPLHGLAKTGAASPAKASLQAQKNHPMPRHGVVQSFWDVGVV
jgi:hypothetical protein